MVSNVSWWLRSLSLVPFRLISRCGCALACVAMMKLGVCLHDFYAPLASPRVLRLLLLPVQPRLTAFVGGQQGQKLVTAGVQAQYEDPHD